MGPLFALQHVHSELHNYTRLAAKQHLSVVRYRLRGERLQPVPLCELLAPCDIVLCAVRFGCRT